MHYREYAFPDFRSRSDVLLQGPKRKLRSIGRGNCQTPFLTAASLIHRGRNGRNFSRAAPSSAKKRAARTTQREKAKRVTLRLIFAAKSDRSAFVNVQSTTGRDIFEPIRYGTLRAGSKLRVFPVGVLRRKRIPSLDDDGRSPPWWCVVRESC